MAAKTITRQAMDISAEAYGKAIRSGASYEDAMQAAQVAVDIFLNGKDK